MHANERRLERYLNAGRRWADGWPELERQVSGLDLPAAHARIVERARSFLPITLESPPRGGVTHG